MTGNYRGEGTVRGEGCPLEAHYTQLQAIIDALGHAAQLHMSDAIEAEDIWRWLAERARGYSNPIRSDCLAAAVECASIREQHYGAWIALGKVLRVVETAGNLANLHADLSDHEKAMVQRIDWSAERFLFPSYEMFEGVEVVQPGAAVGQFKEGDD